jgi:general secretion pathway protein G
MSLKAQGKKKGFTLVELLIVVIIIAVLAAIAIPKFVNSSLRSKEASLRGELKLLRDAVELFKNDCGCYPASTAGLTATTAPTTGLTATAATYTIVTSNWRGPYISSIDNDPVSGAGINYSIASGSVGQFTSSATGNDSTGSTAYSSY